jgi:adenosylcobinamide amidohydrolase
MKSTLFKIVIAAILAVGTNSAIGENPVLARDCTLDGGCRDFMQASLRGDLSDVYYAFDYRIQLFTSGQGNAPAPWFTTAWLSVNLAQGDPGPYPDKFTQIGIKTNVSGTFWFVESEAGVTCSLGHQRSWRLCEGDPNQFVSPNNWSYVELATYLQGFWIARVYEPNGTPHDVATIQSGSGRIWEPNATFEEAYNLSYDPHYNAYFYFKHPQYMSWTTGFQEWVTSVGSGADNFIYATDLDGQNTFCAQNYGATPYYSGDSRAWYAGTGGQQCSWLLFPSFTSYEPSVRTDPGWSSQLFVFNSSTSNTWLNRIFWRADGSAACASSSELLGNATWTNTACSQSSASLVESSHDVSVAVTNKKSTPLMGGAYTAIPASKTSGTFYVPLVIRRRATASGLATSVISIQNAGATATTVQIQLIAGPGSPGSNYTPPPIYVAANGSLRYELKNQIRPELPDGWFGSAVVSGGTLAVVSDFFSWSEATVQTFNAFPANSPGTQWFVPTFLSRRSSMTGNISTPLNVQNLSGQTIPVNGITLYCLAAPGVLPSTLTVNNTTEVVNYASYGGFNPATDTNNFPAEWYGSCRVQSSYNVITLVQIRYPGTYNNSQHYYQASAYEAIRGGGVARHVSFPLIQKRLSDGSATSVTIQNLSTTSAATITFYYAPSCVGYSSVTVGPYTIPAGASINHNHREAGYGSGTGYHGLPDGWCGSLTVVSADQPIDGFAQLTDIDTLYADTIMAHNATTWP